jgi:hypothetical protein
VSEREPYDWIDGSESWSVGHVAQLTEKRLPDRPRHPVGFAPPSSRSRRKLGGRKPGSWPEVPYFDERGT